MLYSSILTAIAAVSLASPPLEIEGVEASYSWYSPPRSGNEYFPGDFIFFRFQVRGVEVRSGRVNLECRPTLLDSKGDVVSAHPELITPTVCLRGAMPATTCLSLPENLAPGEYTFRSTVLDKNSEGSARFERRVVIKPRQLALAAVTYALDPELKSPTANPSRLSVGQSLFVAILVIMPDPTKAPRLRSRIVLTDEESHEIVNDSGLVNLESQRIQAVGKNIMLLTSTSLLASPGRFTFRIDLTDDQANESIRVETPLRVAGLDGATSAAVPVGDGHGSR